MRPALIVSPHLDDAVLSAGQVMAGRPNMTVATVFAGVPARADQLTSFDTSCGFANAEHAVRVRRHEDRAALGHFAAHAEWFEFPDGQYGEPADEADIVAQLLATVRRLNPNLLIGPLGLVHPDHLIVRRAYQALVDATGIEAWVYEDVPSRVLWPEEVPDALAWWNTAGYKPEFGFVGTGPLEKKDDALGCYSSQHWWMGEHWHACLVRERLWRLWP
jgi:LmbE family N-acetylglucosaminyl deacetylase